MLLTEAINVRRSQVLWLSMILAAALSAIAIAPFVALSSGGNPIFLPSALLLGSAIAGFIIAVASIPYLQPYFPGRSDGKEGGHRSSAFGSDQMYVEATATDDGDSDDRDLLESDLSRLAEVWYTFMKSFILILK